MTALRAHAAAGEQHLGEAVRRCRSTPLKTARSVGALPDSAMTCLGNRLRQRTVDRAGQQMAGQLPRVAGRGIARVEDASPSGASTRDRAIGAFVARRQRIERAFDRIDRIGVGVVHHRVEAAVDLLRGAGIVDVQCRSPLTVTAHSMCVSSSSKPSASTLER